MKTWLIPFVALAMAVFLSGCGDDITLGAAPANTTDTPFSEATVNAPESTNLETVADDQGKVTVAVTPVKLTGSESTLDFEVVMDTHSVDLSMNLVDLATLTTDNGRSVAAVSWDGVSEGHHVTGVLSFPASVDGATLLEGASRLILTIRDVDAPLREFSWSLAQSQ